MSAPVSSAPQRTISANLDYWSNFAIKNALKLHDKSSGFGINVCQCCSLTGVVKNMFYKFKYMDNVEVYAAMIEKVFGIQFPQNNSGDRHICLVCVEKLRNAVEFKQQVLETQDKITDQLRQSNKLSLEPFMIKDEPLTELENINKYEDNSNKYNYDNKFEDANNKINYDCNKYEDANNKINIDINRYEGAYNKINNVNNRYVDDNNKDEEKVNVEEVEIHFEDDNDKSDEDFTGDADSDWLPEESLPLKDIKKTIKPEIKATESKIIKPNNNLKNKIIKKKNHVAKEYTNDCIVTQIENKIAKVKKKKLPKKGRNQYSSTIQTERLLDMKYNTIVLLRNSNACLYRYKFNKFECYRCKTFFMDFEQLREHSTQHTWEEIHKDINSFYMILYRKVDISNLKCIICDIDVSDFVELRTHLSENHKIKFRGLEDLLVPYRIKDLDFRCVVCNKKFQNYCKLNIHTNQHYQSFICELCGSGFICEKNLKSHKEKTHEKKKYKCKECKIEFRSEYLKRLHNTKVHDSEAVRVCLYCPERFHQHTKKMIHMVKVHGHKMKLHSCNSCEKSFMTNSLLKTHVKLTHMKVKEFECCYCGARFSHKQNLKVHIERHCCKNSET